MSPPLSALYSSAEQKLPASVREILDGFGRTRGAYPRLWVAREEGGWRIAYPEDPSTSAAEPGPDAVELNTGGGPRAKIEVPSDVADAEASARFLAGVIGHLLRHDREGRRSGAELIERYEEITLLYTISEILGSFISLEQAADRILAEVASVLGARRAALWVHDSGRGRLELAAAVGEKGQTGPIEVDDRLSITAEVFRKGRHMILEPGDIYPRGETNPELGPREYFLSVPVRYSPPTGATRTVGVINLTGSTSGQPYLASDIKLVSAIASQIGAAVENSRLVAETLRRERLVRELELAHDLQLKLLPSLDQFAGFADIAARCVPADSVGGDFYHLFRLSGGRLGVMIGDVSSHGFGAALIMAMTMSAVTVHASGGDSPRDVIRRVHRTLIDELESTEMYMTLFYGVIDPGGARITYVNAGHQHAFRISGAGSPDRLCATNPPLGMVDLDVCHEASAPWMMGEDLLLLFTDGLAERLAESARKGEQVLLDRVLAARDAPAAEIVERIFRPTGESLDRTPADDRTAILVRF